MKAVLLGLVEVLLVTVPCVVTVTSPLADRAPDPGFAQVVLAY